MRKDLALTFLLTVCAGCSGQPGTQATQSEPASGVSSGTVGVDETKMTGNASSEEWSTEKRQSTIDGETYLAKRVYDFPQHQSRFEVTLACVVATGSADLAVDSFVGETKAPSPQSAFLSEGGRVKSADGTVSDLSAYFSVGSEYSNRITLDKQRLFSEQVASSSELDKFRTYPLDEEINQARAYLATLPMIVEVKNGAGTFELDINKSRSVTDLLTACGGDQELLKETYVVRSRQIEEQVRDTVVKNLKNICSYRGKIRVTGEDWIEHAKTLSIPLDCNASAPSELAEFNSKIDSYLQMAQTRGFQCQRDALIKQAEDQGLDESMWSDSNYLQLFCKA